MIERTPLLAVINALGFVLQDGEGEKYSKHYRDCEIILDISNNKIIYPKTLLCGRNTTCNFNHSENLVVLECVNRLLDAGYSADCLELERPFGAGRSERGQWLDVFVKRPDGTAFAMIECKTYGSEHDRERDKMIRTGGQLVNYFLNHSDTDFIVLYSSELYEGSIKAKADIISTAEFRGTTSREHFLEQWDKTFENNGFFDVEPYGFSPGIRKDDLIEISYADIYSTDNGDAKGTIFNRFAEILRRHAVSDKSNSYNKVFNLFLCKIVDEDEKKNSDIMDFQWKKGEAAEEVMGRLSDLYKKGMKKYLELAVTDHTENEFERVLNNRLNDRALQIFREIRLYKDNEFAFKEVINKDTFDNNAKVVKEVVKLLEPYKIKYSTKHQFLGDFFERLLNIGIKQEAGQFFTPIPIARFMVNSLPIKDIVRKKIADRDADFLPYIIDYACGSGHFLTEIMSSIEDLIGGLSEDGLTRPQLDNLRKWKAAPYSWCKDFVYGIEKDYRLAKTTKVASFLNGDGQANVIYGDGLDSFGSPTYRGILSHKEGLRDNQQFDIVIANPPFSVEGFKETLDNGKHDFTLFKSLGDSSDDIECLFVERTAQLLREEGVAAVVLPSSVLVNTGIHQKARELLLANFEVIGIQELGGGVFAATDNNTVIAFLRKRTEGTIKWNRLHDLIEGFISDGRDFNFDGQRNVISRYCEDVLGGDISVSEVRATLQANPSQASKIQYFATVYNQKIILGRFPKEKEKAKIFLGYEHSARDKYEGIRPYPRSRTTSVITSSFYSDSDIEDEEKVSSYVLKTYRKEDIADISSSIDDYTCLKQLGKLINFRTDDFAAKILLDGVVEIKATFGKEDGVISLADKDLFVIKKGSSITRMDVQPGDIPVMAGGQNPAYFHNEANRSGEVITVSASGKYAGFISYFNKPIWASDCNTIQLTDKGAEKVNLKYLYMVLKGVQEQIYLFNTGNTNGHVYDNEIKTIKFFRPSKTKQDEIVESLWSSRKIEYDLADIENALG